MTALAKLKHRFERIAIINEASSMLAWDSSVMMPPGGAAARGDQLAVLAGLSHQLLTDPATAEWLAAASAPAQEPADEWEAANLRLIRRAHARAIALPGELVEAQSRANSRCEKVWRQARQESDYARVKPYLAEVLKLVREAARLWAEQSGSTPYDALMDGFQPGIGAADVAPVFARYETFLRETLDEIEARQADGPAPVAPAGPFPADRQEALCRKLSERIGLDYTRARLDRSAHPFSGGTPTDTRITTRYDEADFTSAALGVIHETGHALYEQRLPSAWARQPVGEAAGMAAHESQSLIVEMQAGRSDAFLRFLAPELAATFGPDPAFEAGNLARLWRRVHRGFIRVEADEVTYPAHVILRFRLEQALIGGDLGLNDLPAAWNDGIKALLGIAPPDDARGCLQDIHWYDGLFGYFPSYTLGAMAAAQLMAAARREAPAIDEALGVGSMAPLQDWLTRKVHVFGSRYGFNDLLRHATGSALSADAFEAHLRARYLG
ncbi:carboxypeptidase M32 [Rhodoblastus sphagnicola]|uniref:Metal-dependent carboxypeptidase n=1 Tax=Rhodoblastus sphagnicola TaxID=333368 RepID=A0A2S6N395_9HYPH|nr:carboxypeptidase M32 [Rhodoblastus sphagnicola]PPQ29089.1 carboxypeptidase M32 [Rhodoblastus sphagnicola]